MKKSMFTLIAILIGALSMSFGTQAQKPCKKDVPTSAEACPAGEYPEMTAEGCVCIKQGLLGQAGEDIVLK